jgi:aspartyl protease family protein
MRGSVLRSLVWVAVAVAAAAGLLTAQPPTGGTPPQRAPGAAAGRDGWNRITVPADDRGHFLVTAEVNGTAITFLVDSGASTVVLSPDDARRIGLSAARLRFTERFRTANGTVRAAPVELREIRIGQLTQRYVPASVNEAPMGVSLLGMTFLSRLESWSVEGGRLALYW